MASMLRESAAFASYGCVRDRTRTTWVRVSASESPDVKTPLPASAEPETAPHDGAPTLPANQISELRSRAERAAVGTRDAIALNARLVEVTRRDTVAANRLGRGLMEVGRHADALAVFERVLQLDPKNVVATRRASDLRARLAAPRRGRTAVTNAQTHDVAGEFILRRARKIWVCQGKGTPAAHALGCARKILPGHQYVEITWGEVSYMESHRVSLDCARDLWNCTPPR